MIKYEHPLETPTEAFFLKAPAEIWELTSKNYAKPLPANYKDLPYQAFWIWVLAYNLPVVICEGIKKTAAVLSLGVPAIGVPGIWGAYRNPKNEFGENDGDPFLIPEIQKFATKDRQILFCFDQDQKRTTVRNVNRAITKTAKLFQKKQCNVSVMQWNSALGKGIDDVIAGIPKSFAEGLIEAKSFGEVPTATEIFFNIYKGSVPFQRWSTFQLKKLTYIPNVVVNSKYMPDISLPGDQFICIQAPKGTGKTTLIKNWITPITNTGEKPVLGITHRESLGRKIANDLGVLYVDELDKEGLYKFFGYALCVDSLHENSQAKFNYEKFKGGIVVIDEIVQFLKHLLNSSTCKKNRVVILKNLRLLLTYVVETGGKIIIADADLNDTAIDYIKKIINIEPHIIVNDFIFNEPWNIYHYNDKKPARLLSKLKDKVLEGKKVLICVGGQQEKSLYSTTTLEVDFKKVFPDKKILRVDSHTVANPGHEACGIVDNLEHLKDYDIVITSPTIETGTSIDFYHFDVVFEIATGVQTTDSVRQHMSRYRKPVDRHVWIAKTGIRTSSDGDGSDTVEGLLKREKKNHKIHKNHLTGLGFTLNLDGSGLENNELQTWARLTAIDNSGKKNYRNQILEDLRAEGHHVIDVEPEDDVVYSLEGLQETREENYEKHRVQTSEAEDIDLTKHEELKKKRDKTDKEYLEVKKADLVKTYGIEVTPELVKLNDNDWYEEIYLHYLVIHPEFFAQKELNNGQALLNNGRGETFIPDANKASTYARKVLGLRNYLRIDKLLTTNGMCESHPLAVEVGNISKAKIFALRELGINLLESKKDYRKLSNMSFCHKIVHMLGLKYPKVKQVRADNGKTEWVHGLPAPGFEYLDKKKTKVKLDIDGNPVIIPDLRDEVFAQWVERDTTELEKQNAKRTQAEMAEEYNARVIAEFQQGNYQAVENLAKNMENHKQHVADTETRDLISTTIENTWKELGKNPIAHQAFPEVYKNPTLQPKQNTGCTNFKSTEGRQVEIAETLEARALKCDDARAAAKLIKANMQPDNPKSSENIAKILYLVGEPIRRELFGSTKFFNEVVIKTLKQEYSNHEAALA
ncbi:DUF3854 domain-containing protein [Aetokthonos hydrillicola Thurmond2011]|uniref:DUF3854 domain-containing protein n=1 Tax=Aetokthonos hydrillicola Thurmond2011 TaxID=2712845 RepID=A0AAP5IFQ4_9CYAN|nr:plasmid replication protein, CyRepA1 family [Aetokthonos hydrillicola]MBW4591125.1 DUF3854 domain-containing protein [Aetokthonos hydrillicola CCALA 1050]MDR9900893.1 DUF3854 domain-containing protein [Aetokthonos hydrillicola Thurmond2011]